MINRLKRIVQHNFLAKVTSVIVAIVLWMTVMDDQDPTIDKEFSVPVVLVNSPKGYKITQNQDTATVKVRTQRSSFVEVDSGAFKARADITGLEEGVSQVPIQVQMPIGFELVEINPKTVEVVMDPYIEVQLPAELIVTGAPSPNVTIAKITQDHQMVTVIGPKSVVTEVSRVIGYVGLTGNDADFDLQAPLSAISEEGRDVSNVRVVPSIIAVHVQMARGLSKKVVSVLPILEKDLPGGYEVDAVQVSPSSIEIAGDDKLFSGIQGIETERISLKDKTETFTTSVKLVPPEGITVTNQEVNVNIVIKKKIATGDE